MENFNFYKELFEKELSRKVEIENSVNIPIGILTLLISSVFFLNKNIYGKTDFLIKIGMVLIVISITLSFVFLTKSFNNFFKGFKYKNLPDTIELRNYQLKLNEYNSQVKKDEKESFKNYLIDNYIQMTDNNLKINRKRLYDLFISKTFIIISIILTMILGIIIISKNNIL
ncbi:MAG: hypothetical protein EVB11_11045 [Winogradskyella sp.]|nr:MAG: hypothetical protein EVB11_11045 [Winogradskyella sp.]